jgi:1,4-dihydroxy-2-naphthoate polyprenyltransferase
VRLRAWIQAARPLAHANIAPALLAGQALACADGARFDWIFFAIAHVFGALDHVTIVFANDYADFAGDTLNQKPTVFSGGSRVLPEGKLAPRDLFRAAIACAALLALGSLGGVLIDRPLLPAFAAVALLLLGAYSFPPLRLSYRGGGELLQGLGVGLVLPLLGYYLQRGRVLDAPWAIFAAFVVMHAASNIVTAIPDIPADARAQKRTWPVRRGELRARRDALVLIAISLLMIARFASLEPAWLAFALAPSLLLLLLAVPAALRTGAVLRFVVPAAGAITTVQIALSIAFFVAHR